MADYTHVPDPPQLAHDGGSGWGIRAPKDTANHDWDAPSVPLPPPLPALVHAPAPMLEVAPPPLLPPPTPRGAPPPPPGALPRKPRNRMVMVAANGGPGMGADPINAGNRIGRIFDQVANEQTRVVRFFDGRERRPV